jgi:transcriptional regulator with XRE-family HTH domain
MQGNIFRDIRKGMKLTQEELGKELGLSQKFIGMMERGDAPIERRTWLALLYLHQNPSDIGRENIVPVLVSR